MQASWLHVSDFHFRGGDPYDRDVVLRALVQSVRRFRERGRKVDLVFATGDVAHAGQEKEYAAATTFFDALIAAAGIDKRHLFVIPGNHDVDRDRADGLARTLTSREESDRYFRPGVAKLHLTHKLAAFADWHDRYFAGIRSLPRASTCGPVEAVEIAGHKLGVLPINSALFCLDDADYGKLWVGRRCLDAAIEALAALGADITVALIHHPLDWLADSEAANIKAALASHVDVILRGHLHKNDVESVAGIAGESLYLAAGAAYQKRGWPNRALYASIDTARICISPIRYEDDPQEVWTIDPSLFPHDPQYERGFELPRRRRVLAARSAPVQRLGTDQSGAGRDQDVPAAVTARRPPSAAADVPMTRRQSIADDVSLSDADSTVAKSPGVFKAAPDNPFPKMCFVNLEVPRQVSSRDDFQVTGEVRFGRAPDVVDGNRVTVGVRRTVLLPVPKNCNIVPTSIYRPPRAGIDTSGGNEGAAQVVFWLTKTPCWKAIS